MIYLIYASSAVKPFTQPGLIELLTKAREKNSKLGITGMLLYKDNNFMQVLEGEEEAVRELYDTIGKDPRHKVNFLIDEGKLAKRQFGDWSMGFRNLSDKDVQSIPGFNQFMNKPLNAAEFRSDPTGCRGWLNLFREKSM